MVGTASDRVGFELEKVPMGIAMPHITSSIEAYRKIEVVKVWGGTMGRQRTDQRTCAFCRP